MTLLFHLGFLNFNWKDFLDIMLVTMLLVQVYKLMQGSVAIKVFIGFLLLYLFYLVVNALEMELLGSILGQFMGVGVIAVIILFQQEIRKFLLVLGKTNILDREVFFDNFRHWFTNETTKRTDKIQLIEAVKTMSKDKTGALIVMSLESPLKFYADSGDFLDAVISKRLLLSIFGKKSPLHDGAVIIHKNRIVAARCVLPVTEQDLPAHFGLRHRAAVGMSENTNSIVIVVSEETGNIFTIHNGQMTSEVTIQQLRRKIDEYLHEKRNEKESKTPSSSVSTSNKVLAETP